MSPFDELRVTCDYFASCSFFPACQILHLFGRQCIDGKIHRRKLQLCDLLIDLRRERDDIRRTLPAVLHKVLACERLSAEGETHHLARMAFRRRKIHQATFARDKDDPAGLEQILIQIMTYAARTLGILFQ